MPAGLNTLYFLMNTGFGFTLVALILYYFVKDRESAYEKLQQSQLHIRELMLTDPLTGIANRRHLDERLAVELARQQRNQQPLAVIMTDIDWFKNVNDNFGHAAGDRVLQIFAGQLRQNIRNFDFLARYGGEEFVLLLPNTGSEEALHLAERMREAIKHMHLDDMDLKLTASFGVTIARTGETMEQVMVRADKAMYQSKTRGRDRITFIES